MQLPVLWRGVDLCQDDGRLGAGSLPGTLCLITMGTRLSAGAGTAWGLRLLAMHQGHLAASEHPQGPSCPETSASRVYGAVTGASLSSERSRPMLPTGLPAASRIQLWLLKMAWPCAGPQDLAPCPRPHSCPRCPHGAHVLLGGLFGATGPSA